MAFRPDEERCARVFETWLRQNGRQCSCAPGPENLAPDIEARVDGEPWAVEVSGLHWYLGGREDRPYRRVDAPIQELAKRLQLTIEDERGAHYVLNTSSCEPIHNIAKLVRNARNHVASGRSDPLLLDEGTGLVLRVIRMHPGMPSQVVAAPEFHPILGTGTREEITEEIGRYTRYAVQRALEHKLPRITTLTGFERRVLLIYSAHALVGLEGLHESVAAESARLAHLDAITYISMQETIEALFDAHGILPKEPGYPRPISVDGASASG